MEQKKHRILIVDNNNFVGESVSRLLNNDDDLHVCGVAQSGIDGLIKVETMKPDMAVVDMTLNDMSGLDLIRKIRKDGLKFPVLVSSIYDESLYAEHALTAGAQGFIMKQQSAEEFIRAVHVVLSGNIYLSNRILGYGVVGSNHAFS